MAEILGLLVLLVLSGLFSGSETALVSLSLARTEALMKEGRRGAQALYRLKHNPSRMLITILIGNNVVNIGASALATVLATERLGHLGPGVAVGVLTVLILMFGEITPKSLATRYAERISLAAAPLMLAIMRLCWPLVRVFELFTSWVHRRTALGTEPTITESELIHMLEHGAAEGTIQYREREIIERVFAFNDLKVTDVMTPRRRIFSLAADQSLEAALPEILGASFSRIPVYDNAPEEICGVLYLRDVLAAVADRQMDITLRSLARDPLAVPPTLGIDQLFTTLSTEQRHLALVVDELGTLEGVVSLEDLVEELVGEIYDESDRAPTRLLQLGPETVVADGTAELRELERFFGRDLPGKPTDTISYWILAHTGRIPETGEEIMLDGLQVRVEKASPRRIHRLRISGGRSAAD